MHPKIQNPQEDSTQDQSTELDKMALKISHWSARDPKTPYIQPDITANERHTHPNSPRCFQMKTPNIKLHPLPFSFPRTDIMATSLSLQLEIRMIWTGRRKNLTFLYQVWIAVADKYLD